MPYDIYVDLKKLLTVLTPTFDSLSLAISTLKKGLRPWLMGLVICSKNCQKTQVYHCAIRPLWSIPLLISSTG